MRSGPRTCALSPLYLPSPPLPPLSPRPFPTYSQSNRFYNAGWTTDLRFVISLVQQDYPHAPLYAIGTSLGANILVKYLGEEGATGPIQAAVSIGNPWDLLICDRWMNRRTRQRVYNTAMVTGLRDFAKLHKDIFQHLVDVQHLCSPLFPLRLLFPLSPPLSPPPPSQSQGQLSAPRGRAARHE
ncbi:unnamed protein product, partial [Closterium sp. NIES-54]